LLTTCFSSFENSRTMGFVADVDSKDDLLFARNIFLKCPLGVPLLRLWCEHKWHLCTTLFWAMLPNLFCLCLTFDLFFSIRTVELKPRWRTVSHLPRNQRMINIFHESDRT
jgi:hypothetical protein